MSGPVPDSHCSIASKDLVELLMNRNPLFGLVQGGRQAILAAVASVAVAVVLVVVVVVVAAAAELRRREG